MHYNHHLKESSMSVHRPARHALDRRRRALAKLIVGGCAGFALLAVQAHADARPQQRTAIVHQTPSVPITIDGVTYAPEQIRRFDGRPLYVRTANDGRSLLGYTELARFKAFLRTKGIRLPAPTKALRPPLKRAAAGHTTKFCTDRFEQGWCYTINSGWGLANVRALNGSNPWTSWTYENNIESVRVNGPGAVLFDRPNFDPAGGVFYLYPNEVIDLTLYGWGNRVDSIYQPW